MLATQEVVVYDVMLVFIVHIIHTQHIYTCFSAEDALYVHVYRYLCNLITVIVLIHITLYAIHQSK